jgi:SSS family solute:Na+ symporter
MPLTQPQLTVRLAILKSDRQLKNMSIAYGLFALLVILPTIVLGFYGAITLSGMKTADFIANTVVFHQSPVIASLAIVGLIAAAMSTADSILFSLGNEIQSMFPGTERDTIIRSKIAIFVFAVVATVLALISNDQLVLLARVSFTGTALLLPIIVVAVFTGGKHINIAVMFSCLLLVVFILSLLGIIPNTLQSLRLDLVLLGISLISSLIMRLTSAQK